MKKIFSLFGFVGLASLSLAQTTCTDSLKVIADYDACLGYNSGSGANTNYGTAQQNAAYTIPGNGNRALIHFDLSLIPATATITAAYLDLYACYPLGTLPGHQGPNNASLLQRALSPWSEMSVTWNNQPTASTVNQVTLAGTSTYSLDYLGINVTTLIKDIFASGNNNGMLLRMVNETSSNCLSFCSKDHPVAAKHPFLKVYYACVPTGVAELSANVNFKIAPNPAKDILNISVEGNLKESEFVIYDILGKQVLKQEGLDNSNTFQIGHLSPGAYFYRIKVNRESKTGKFIKQ